jgi:hypothetical protein
VNDPCKQPLSLGTLIVLVVAFVSIFIAGFVMVADDQVPPPRPSEERITVYGYPELGVDCFVLNNGQGISCVVTHRRDE